MYSQTQIEHVTLLMMDVLETYEPLYLESQANRQYRVLTYIDYRANVLAGIRKSLSVDNFICAIFHRICFNRRVIRGIFDIEIEDIAFHCSPYKCNRRQHQTIVRLIGKIPFYLNI